jgi:NADH:ubiquinone oxidoreductase subunit 5 (subunit L)/multisubunit Na+/H+ antiporter MnhA subunit
LIINRIGDFGLLCGLLIIFYFFRTVDFSIIFTLAPFFKNIVISFMNVNIYCLNIICFFLFLGSVGKSAQIGLHV